MFKVGDTVTWESQSNSRTTIKTGQVIAVLSPCERPDKKLGKTALNDYTLMFDCCYNNLRKAVSYLISVPSKSGRGKPKLYWPLTKNLKST